VASKLIKGILGNFKEVPTSCDNDVSGCIDLHKAELDDPVIRMALDHMYDACRTLSRV
jgi:hypothetical protein